MSSSDLWRYSMICSALIIFLGSLEIIGIWTIGKDNLVFGIGVIITGGVMLFASATGYIEARMDEVQQILDDLQSDMNIFSKRTTDEMDPEEKP